MKRDRFLFYFGIFSFVVAQNLVPVHRSVKIFVSTNNASMILKFMKTRKNVYVFLTGKLDVGVIQHVLMINVDA